MELPDLKSAYKGPSDNFRWPYIWQIGHNNLAEIKQQVSHHKYPPWVHWIDPEYCFQKHHFETECLTSIFHCQIRRIKNRNRTNEGVDWIFEELAAILKIEEWVTLWKIREVIQVKENRKITKWTKE